MFPANTTYFIAVILSK